VTNLIRSLRRSPQQPEERSGPPWPNLPLAQWANFFGFNGLDYGYVPTGTLGTGRHEIGADFRGYVEGAYKSNGVVFACMLVRMLLFSEARFQFRQRRSGRPGDLFGTGELGVLEKPGGPRSSSTTGDLLLRAIQDADLAGNWFGTRRTGDRIKRIRPDRVTIIYGSDTRPDADATFDDLDAELLGYVHHRRPGAPEAESGPDIDVLLPEEVAHFAPIPDPAAQFRGMSWLAPVVREIMGDVAATEHKLQFYENGATPNIIVTMPEKMNPDQVQRYADVFNGKHRGIANAYETLFLGGGAGNPMVVGANMQQASLKEVQGAGETRIAAAAGVPPIIAGFSEGLESATYSNYSQARRRFADGTMRPLWRNMAGSLSAIIRIAPGAELWYDDRDIPFLAEDVKDAAEVQGMNAQAIRTLVDGGFDPDAVIDAVTAGDLRRLKGNHGGLLPVQLQPPGSGGNSTNSSESNSAPAPGAGRALLAQFVNGH
jgi:hypothetical protein